MAAPTFGAAGTYLSGSFTSGAAVAVPTGTAADEIVVVLIYVESGNGTITAPAGFTQRVTINGSDHDLEIWWKRCTATDSGTYAFTWSGNPWREAVALRFSGCITTGDPFDVSNTATGTGGTTPAVTASTTVADTLLLWAGTNFNSGAWTPPTAGGTWTERVDTGGGIGAATKAQAATGTTGSVTGSCAGGAATSLAFLGALKPPAVSGTNAPAGSGPVSTTAATAAGQVRPAATASATTTAAQSATSQLRPGATSAAVAVSAASAAATIGSAPTSAPVALAAAAPSVQVRAQAGVAAVGVAGHAPTVSASSSTSANATSGPVAVTAQPATAAVRPAAAAAPVSATAPAPTVAVLANAGVAAVAAVAADATVSTANTVSANADVAAVGVVAANPEARVPQLKVLATFAAASADPHSLTIPGATAGRDIWLIVNTAAVVTTPAGWTDEADRVATMATYIYRLDGASNPGGSIGVTLDLSATRALAAVAVEAKTYAAGTLYASLLVPLSAPGSTTWGTNAHTFTARDDVLAIYALHSAVTPPTFNASGYDQGFTALADTGWAGTGGGGDEATRILVGFGVEQGFTASGVTLTLDAAGPTGSAVGFLAFDEAAGTIATPATVAVTAGAAVATVRAPATSGPVATAAQTPLATVAPQAGQGAVTLTGQPATVTVRANAGVAAVTAQGQAATVNTSSSTNANAGVAAVGVTASAAAASVRPAAGSAPVGAAGLFDTGSLPILQLVMDNPVGITVTAYNATVSTSAGPTNANAGGAPVSTTGQPATAQARPRPTSAAVALTAPTPAVTVRANAGVAAVGVAGLQPAVAVAAQAGVAPVGVAGLAATAQTTSQTVAQAGVATVATSAAGSAATVRANPTGATITGAANAPLVSTGGQVFAPATVAAIATSSASASATLRPAAGGAVAALSAAGPLTTVRLRPTTATVITLALAASGPPPQFAGGLNVLLQIQTLTKVRPAEIADGYGNTVLDYGVAATRTTFAGWIWQANRSEARPDGRNPAEQLWELMCNESDLLTDDRVEWPSGHPSGPLTFAIEGPPQPSYRAGSGFGAGGFHHVEASMRLVEG